MSVRLLILSNRVPVEFLPPTAWIPRIRGPAGTLMGRKVAAQICMARLRAERKGRDTSGFPPRIRNIKRKKQHANLRTMP